MEFVTNIFVVPKFNLFYFQEFLSGLRACTITFSRFCSTCQKMKKKFYTLSSSYKKTGISITVFVKFNSSSPSSHSNWDFPDGCREQKSKSAQRENFFRTDKSVWIRRGGIKPDKHGNEMFVIFRFFTKRNATVFIIVNQHFRPKITFLKTLDNS